MIDFESRLQLVYCARMNKQNRKIRGKKTNGREHRILWAETHKQLKTDVFIWALGRWWSRKSGGVALPVTELAGFQTQSRAKKSATNCCRKPEAAGGCRELLAGYEMQGAPSGGGKWWCWGDWSGRGFKHWWLDINLTYWLISSRWALPLKGINQLLILKSRKRLH